MAIKPGTNPLSRQTLYLTHERDRIRRHPNYTGPRMLQSLPVAQLRFLALRETTLEIVDRVVSHLFVEDAIIGDQTACRRRRADIRVRDRGAENYDPVRPPLGYGVEVL